MANIDPEKPRQSTVNQLVFWGALALVVVGILWIRQGAGFQSEGRRHPAVGAKLPSLELKGLTGTATDVDLKSLENKVVLINFWGTWCPPCRAELPHIAQLRRDFAAHKDFRLLAVSCPGEEENITELRSATQDFLNSKDIDIPTYADPGGATRRAVGMAMGSPQLDIPGFPTTLLLDRKGVIQAVWENYVPGTEADMRRAIEEVLKE